MLKLTVLASDLGLRNDQLERVRVVRIGNRVVENANRLEQVANHSDLAGEVRRIRDDLGGFSFKLHDLALFSRLAHCRLDARDLATLVQDLVHGGVEHVRAAIDGGKTCKTLWEFAQAEERVDVRGFAITGHGISVETDALDCFLCLALCVDVVIGGVQSHGVANEVSCSILETPLVIHILH